MHEVYLRQRTFKSTSDIIGRSNTHKTTALFKMKSSADMGMQKNDRQQSQPQTLASQSGAPLLCATLSHNLLEFQSESPPIKPI